MRPFIFIFIFSFSPALFAKEPQMLHKGRLLAEQTFDKAPNPQDWKLTGDTNVVNGRMEWVSGKQKPGIEVLFVKDNPLGDHVMEYSFTYEGVWSTAEFYTTMSMVMLSSPS